MNNIIGRYFFSFLLGGLVFYIFVCFSGVIFSIIYDSGITTYIYKELFTIINNKFLKRVLFLGSESIQEYLILTFIICVFCYFYSSAMNELTLIHAIVFSLGAIASDQLINICINTNVSFLYFTNSVLIESPLLTLFFNFSIWVILTVLSIKICVSIKCRKNTA